MIRFATVGHLARTLGCPPDYLRSVLRHADRHYVEYDLIDPAKPSKARLVVCARGPLRQLQWRLYSRVLLPSLSRSQASHGGVPGRNVLTNLRPHIGNRFVFKADIAQFYPGVHHTRVRRLFEGLGCSADAARCITRLCTYRYCLEQGLVTSPILADTLLAEVDERISSACNAMNLTYTRFVDDLFVSGNFDLDHSGLPSLVERVLRENGFAVNRVKMDCKPVESGITITNLRFPRGHADVTADYAAELERHIDDALTLARGERSAGGFLTECQLWGRARYVAWVNPGRWPRLRSRLSEIDWIRVYDTAVSYGLIERRKILVPRD